MRRSTRSIYLSAKTGQGIDELRQALNGKITAVAGPSGVGKSSLLNVLDPTRDRAVGAISAATGKGRHTTTATVLHRIPGEAQTFVADTPGIRALSLQGVASDELDQFFPEMRPFLGQCRYADCSHLSEPGCAVRAAVERRRDQARTLRELRESASRRSPRRELNPASARPSAGDRRRMKAHRARARPPQIAKRGMASGRPVLAHRRRSIRRGRSRSRARS